MNRIHFRSMSKLVAVALAAAAVSLTGCKTKLVGIAPSISVTPATIAFGQAQIGQSKQATLSITNAGSAPLEVTAVKVANDPNQEMALFGSLATDCTGIVRDPTAPIAPSACAQVTVKWTPKAAHAASGSIEIDSNDTANPAVIVPITGTSVGPLLQYCVLTASSTVDPSACSDLAASPPVEPAVDFGAGTIATPVSRIVRLTNQGAAALNFTMAPSLTGSPDFTLSGTIAGDGGETLAAGATADLTVTATPSAAGTITGDLVLASNDPYAPQLSIPLTITLAPFPSISVTPAMLAYPAGTIGVATSLPVNVTNVGGAPLMISAIKVSLDPNMELKVVNLLTTDCTGAARTASSTLAAGECARFDVAWTPTANHAATGAIEVDSDDPQHAAVTIPVGSQMGTGATSALLQACVLDASGNVVPANCTTLSSMPPVLPTIDFGTATLGTTSTRVVRLTNQGTAALTFAPAPTLAPSGSGIYTLSSALTSNTLAPGATANLTITAQPVAAGTITSALLLDSNDQYDQTVTLPITLSAVAIPVISVSPSSIAFGSTTPGAALAQIVSVKNVGTGALVIPAGGIKVSANPNGDLTVAALLTTDCTGAARTGGNTLQPGECARFNAVWTPTAPGAAAGSIEVDSNDPVTPAVTIPVSGGTSTAPLLQVCVLSGTTVVQSQCTNLGVTPHTIPSLSFGTLQPGTTASNTVRLFNLGNAPLTLSPAPSVSNASTAVFALSGTVAGNTIAANGGTADLTITATASAGGAFTGTFNVSSNDARATTVQIPIAMTVPTFGFSGACAVANSLAFGQVTLGTTATNSITFTNCGQTPLTVKSFALTGAAQFTATLPAAGAALAVNATITVPVTYKPTAVETDTGTISYSFTAASATVSGAVALSGSGYLAACGTSGRNPVPIVTAQYTTDQTGTTGWTAFTPSTTTATSTPVLPLDYVQLNGSSSTYAPGTGPLTYTWTLTSQPAGSTTSLITSGASTKLQTLVSGQYVVTLSVKDATGCANSASGAVTFYVLPQGSIHVELVWNTSCGDLDLHYLPPSGEMCDGNDLFYADLPAEYGGPGFPDWGCANSSCDGTPSTWGGPQEDYNYNDDATLDHDDTHGYGPENVTQKSPFNVQAGNPYGVWVFYYGDNGYASSSCGGITPTVYFYVDGVYRSGWTLTEPMNLHDAWYVAGISVDGPTNVTVTPSSGTNYYTGDYFDCVYERPDAYGYDAIRTGTRKLKSVVAADPDLRERPEAQSRTAAPVSNPR